MKRISLLVIAFVSLVFANSNAMATQGTLSASKVKAGSAIGVTGTIDPGQELFVVICTDKLFSAKDSPGPKEKKRLKNGKKGKNVFGDTAIPSSFYVVTSSPETLATPKVSPKGQTSGVFAFPPFKYNVKVNKIKAWGDIAPATQAMMGPVNSENQWKMLTYTHENKFGMNTIVKEKPSTGGNARMIMSDYGADAEQWNEGVTVTLDKATGKYSVSMSPYKNLFKSTTSFSVATIPCHYATGFDYLRILWFSRSCTQLHALSVLGALVAIGHFEPLFCRKNVVWFVSLSCGWPFPPDLSSVS